MDLPHSRAYRVPNTPPGTREDAAQGLRGKLVAGCRLLVMGLSLPAGWMQPMNCLGTSASSWTPRLAPHVYQFFCDGFRGDSPGNVPFSLQSLTYPWLSIEKLLQSIYTLLARNRRNGFTCCHINRGHELNSSATTFKGYLHLECESLWPSLLFFDIKIGGIAHTGIRIKLQKLVANQINRLKKKKKTRTKLLAF